MSLELWQILVPTERADGRPIHTCFRRVWDAKVRATTGGPTIMPVAKGQWHNAAAELFAEGMIPVRAAATREPVEQIIALTIAYYEQQAVLTCRLSDMVVLRQVAPTTGVSAG